MKAKIDNHLKTTSVTQQKDEQLIKETEEGVFGTFSSSGIFLKK